MPASTANPSQAVIRRELHFFTLYRVLESALLCLTVFSPVGALLGGTPRHPLLAMIVAVAYLLLACGLFFLRRRGKVQAMALLGIAVDITASLLAMHALPSAGSGIAMMLLFNVGAAALLLPSRVSLGVAALAAGALAGDYAWSILAGHGTSRPLA
ncbi:MAG: PAS domain-containing sensor histidine kinase, partial [Caulobacteraceae bacterium]